VRSGPEEARTILLLHIISVRPSKQHLMVRTFLKVYMELCSYFLFQQEQIKDIIIRKTVSERERAQAGAPRLSRLRVSLMLLRAQERVSRTEGGPAPSQPAVRGGLQTPRGGG
jgi:hypothetical protein